MHEETEAPGDGVRRPVRQTEVKAGARGRRASDPPPSEAEACMRCSSGSGGEGGALLAESLGPGGAAGLAQLPHTAAVRPQPGIQSVCLAPQASPACCPGSREIGGLAELVSVVVLCVFGFVFLLCFRERDISVTEKHPSVAFHTHPDWGSGPQPRHVPQLGI